MAIFGDPVKGAKLLDEKNPGWYKKVDMDRLDQRYGLTCVLGQVYGNFGAGTQSLGLNLETEELGFGYFGDNEKWKNLIKERLAMDSQFGKDLDELLKDGAWISMESYGENEIRFEIKANWVPDGSVFFEGPKSETFAKAVKYKLNQLNAKKWNDVPVGELFSIKENEKIVDCLKVGEHKYFDFNQNKIIGKTVDVEWNFFTYPPTIKFISAKA